MLRYVIVTAINFPQQSRVYVIQLLSILPTEDFLNIELTWLCIKQCGKWGLNVHQKHSHLQCDDVPAGQTHNTSSLKQVG
jgi:hypothetical protein